MEYEDKTRPLIIEGIEAMRPHNFYLKDVSDYINEHHGWLLGEKEIRRVLKVEFGDRLGMAGYWEMYVWMD